VDNSDVVQVLLEKGAKVDQESLDGFTPVMKACEQDLLNSLKVLLDHKANPNAVRPSTGDTALHLVARDKKPSAVRCAEILLDAKAVTNIINKAKKTPLDEALENNKEVHNVLKKHMEANEQVAYEAEQELVREEKVKDTHKNKIVDVSSEILRFTAANKKATKHNSTHTATDTNIKDTTPKEDEERNRVKEVSNKDSYKPIMGAVSGNKALSFANGFTETNIESKTDSYEAQIKTLKNEGKRKDKRIVSMQDANNILKDKIKDKKDYIAKLLKKIEKGRSVLSPKHTDHEKSSTTYEPVQPLPLKNIKYRDDLYKILNGEIERFCRSAESIKESGQPTRETCITEIKKILGEINPNLKLVTYGSYATDLWLPFSPIDLMITGNQDQPLLEKIKDMVKKETWCNAVSFIAQKSILKIECKIKNLAVCIHLTLQDTRHKGLEFVELIKGYTKSLPFFGKLGLLLKYLFRIADLNDSYKVFLISNNRKV